MGAHLVLLRDWHAFCSERRMNAFRKILVPTDFSAAAEAATFIAGDLSHRFEAPLTIVYVFERTVYPLRDEYVLFTTEQLDRMFAEFNQRLAGARQQALDARAIEVTTRLLHGWATGEITSFASEGGFDLIVMGTHGRRGIKHLVLGSVAERVVRTAPCAVLTVRAPERA
jgi:universal stress protein A